MTASFDAELVLDARAEVGEGPAWDAGAGRLIWVDITASRVHELRPAGQTRSWDVGEHVGAARGRDRRGDGDRGPAGRPGRPMSAIPAAASMPSEETTEVPAPAYSNRIAGRRSLTRLLLLVIILL